MLTIEEVISLIYRACAIHRNFNSESGDFLYFVNYSWSFVFRACEEVYLYVESLINHIG